MLSERSELKHLSIVVDDARHSKERSVLLANGNEAEEKLESY